MKLGLPFGSRAREEGAPPAETGATRAAPRRRGHLALLVQVFVLLLVLAGYLVWDNYRDAKYGAQYIADAGQLHHLPPVQLADDSVCCSRALAYIQRRRRYAGHGRAAGVRG